MTKNILIYVCIFLIGCHKEKPNYYYINFSDPVSKIIVEGEIKDDKESGLWSVYGSDNSVIVEGFYHNGLKVGKWIYNNFSDSLYWKIFEDSLISINIPNFLTINKDEFFNAYNSDYNLLIIKDTSETALNYHLFNKNEMLNYYDSIIEYEEYIIKRLDDTSFYSRFLIKKKSKEFEMICYVFNIENDTYCIAFKVPNENHLFKRRIFFDILEGCYIEKERVYDPFVYSKFEKL